MDFVFEGRTEKRVYFTPSLWYTSLLSFKDSYMYIWNILLERNRVNHCDVKSDQNCFCTQFHLPKSCIKVEESISRNSSTIHGLESDDEILRNCRPDIIKK